MSCYIAAYGLVSALGAGRDASAEALKAWHDAGVSPLDRHRTPLSPGSGAAAARASRRIE